MTSKANPLPLEKTLRDLALIRACDIDLSNLVPNGQSASDEPANHVSASAVERSYEFVKQARAALKLLNREEVEKQGDRIEAIRGILDDTLKGVQSAPVQ